MLYMEGFGTDPINIYGLGLYGPRPISSLTESILKVFSGMASFKIKLNNPGLTCGQSGTATCPALRKFSFNYGFRPHIFRFSRARTLHKLVKCVFLCKSCKKYINLFFKFFWLVLNKSWVNSSLRSVKYTSLNHTTQTQFLPTPSDNNEVVN